MKKYILSLMSVVTLFAMTSCHDEEFGSNIVQPGSLISFSIDQPRTRTVYESGDQLQIDWLKGDSITIFCQQAEGAKSANYTITPTTDQTHSTKTDEPSKYGLVDYNANGLCWNGAIISENPDHNFYAAYPAGVANAVQTENQLSFPLPNSQECKVSGGLQSAQNYQYVAAPDMRYAYMVAAKKGVKAGDIKSSTTDATGTINLVFAPVMTTLDVVVTYGDDNANVDPLKVTGITVTLPGVPRISGNRFRYQLEENTMSTDEEGDKSSLVTGDLTTSTETFFAGVNMVEVVDGEVKTVGNELALQKGQSVKFTVLLPPVSAANMAKAKIRVNASGSVNYTVTLTGTNIEPSSRRQVNLPAIETPANPKPNNWISQLDGSIYINQLSIPGTNNSASFNAFQNYALSQSYDLKKQWDAGVRAFEFRTGTASAGSSGGMAYKTTCYDFGTNLQYEIGKVFDDLYALVKDTHEFAVVVLSYTGEYSINNITQVLELINSMTRKTWQADLTDGRLSDFRGIQYYLGTTSQHNTRSDYFVKFDPAMTVKDAYGKIILFNMDEYPNYPGALINNAESSLQDTGNAGSTPSVTMVWNARDFNSIGGWHTFTTGGTVTEDKVWVQNATKRNYTSDVAKQSAIINADNEAVKLHTEDKIHNWVINYVGGSAATTTDGYKKTAATNNQFYNDYLIGKSVTVGGQTITRPEGPTGIVMVSHQGVQKTSDGTNVYGENLPQTIINNNFKFRMQRKGDTTEGQHTGQH